MLRIKEILKIKGFTQNELAQKLGITQVALNKTINGNPTIETLLKIAEVLDVDVRELIEPTKDNKTLYIEQNGSFTPIGNLNTETLFNSSDEV